MFWQKVFLTFYITLRLTFLFIIILIGLFSKHFPCTKLSLNMARLSNNFVLHVLRVVNYFAKGNMVVMRLKCIAFTPF